MVGPASGDRHSSGCWGPAAAGASTVTASPPSVTSTGATGSSGGPGGGAGPDNDWVRRAASIPTPSASSWQGAAEGNDGASPTTVATSHTATSMRARRHTGRGNGGGNRGGGGEGVDSRVRWPVRDVLSRLRHRYRRKVGGGQGDGHPSSSVIEGRGVAGGVATTSDSSSYRFPTAPEWSSGGVGGGSRCGGWCGTPTATPAVVAAADGWVAAAVERQVRAAASTRMVAAAAAEAVETASWATTVGGRPQPRGTP
ncbi:hypothetical protein MMPV_008911 [Pyropia vietnamensis]